MWKMHRKTPSERRDSRKKLEISQSKTVQGLANDSDKIKNDIRARKEASKEI